jgi:hypothetical protein
VIFYVRGISTECIRDRLERFCAEAGYRDDDTYLLLASGYGSSIRNTVTEEARQKLRKSIQKGAPVVLRLSIMDAVIGVKRNARLVFSDQTREGRFICAKIGLPSSNRSGSLSREIKARKLLVRFGARVPTPTLLRYDKERLTWLEEEHISENKAISDSEKLGLFLARYALDFYRPTARSRPISTSLRRFQVTLSQLDDFFQEVGMEMPGGIEEATWPVSLLHGDLGASNMVVDKHDRLFLVDWEKCGPGPVARDLMIPYRYLADRDDGSVEPVHNVLHALSDAGDLSPRNQMLIALAVDLIFRQRKGGGEKVKKRLLSLFHRHLL